MTMVSVLTGRGPPTKTARRGPPSSQQASTKQSIVQEHSVRQDLAAAVLAFLDAKPELHKQLLLFEPIMLEDFIAAFNQSEAAQNLAAKFTKKELLVVLDAQNVFLTALDRKTHRKNGLLC